MSEPPVSCGSRYLRYIGNALLFTPIFGRLMQPCCPRRDIERWVKKQEKQVVVERFNNTLRQRVSWLVRKTLLFSKSLENHIGAIWYFVYAYN